MRCGRGSGRLGTGGPRGWPARREQGARSSASPRGARRPGQLLRGTPARDRTAEPSTRARLPRARPTPPARRGPAGSPVRQGPSDTVTDLTPVLPRRFASQDPSCPSRERVRPRVLDSRFVVLGRSLKADQELGDQACTLLLGEREGLAKQRLRAIGHGAIVPLGCDAPATDPQRLPSRRTSQDGRSGHVRPSARRRRAAGGAGQPSSGGSSCACSRETTGPAASCQGRTTRSAPASSSRSAPSSSSAASATRPL